VGAAVYYAIRKPAQPMPALEAAESAV